MEAIIRKIKHEDDVAVAAIIRTVMPEFGASGQGFAIHDQEVDSMFNTYNQAKAAYFVCEMNGKVVGGGGIGPLAGGDTRTCELKKMYFLPEGRGKGLGQRLLAKCLEEARKIGYEYCYLETFNTMKRAMQVYERNQFRKINGPMGSTGHFACDVFYLLKL